MLLVSILILFLGLVLVIDMVLEFKGKAFLSYEQKAFSMVGLVAISVIASMLSSTTGGTLANAAGAALWGWNLYTLQTKRTLK